MSSFMVSDYVEDLTEDVKGRRMVVLLLSSALAAADDRLWSVNALLYHDQ